MLIFVLVVFIVFVSLFVDVIIIIGGGLVVKRVLEKKQWIPNRISCGFACGIFLNKDFRIGRWPGLEGRGWETPPTVGEVDGGRGDPVPTGCISNLGWRGEECRGWETPPTMWEVDRVTRPYDILSSR